MTLADRASVTTNKDNKNILYNILFCLSSAFMMSIYYISYVVGSKGVLFPSVMVAKYSYNRGSLIYNYFNAGFVRRGLGGSVVALFGNTFIKSGIFFHFASIVWLDISIFFLIKIISKSVNDKKLIYICFVTLLSPQVFIGWSTELVKTDIFVQGCIVWSLVFILNGRPIISALAIVLGSLAHETAIIFGLPITAVFVGQLTRHNLYTKESIIKYVGVVAGLTIIIMTLQHFFSPSHERMVQVLNSALSKWGGAETDEGIAIASYFNIAGMRGLRTAICENANDSRFILNALFGAAIILVYIPILLMDKKYLQFSFVALLPYVAMLCIATDTGRWLKFAVSNACWLAMCSLLMQREQSLHRNRAIFGICATLALLVMGPTHFSVVNSAADKVMNAMGLPPTGFGYAALARCDSQWHSVLESN